MPGKKTIVVIALACILGAVVLFLNQSPTPDADDSNATLKTEGSPDSVTKSFFDSYSTCQQNPNLPPEAQGNISHYCQGHTGYTTSTFLKNLKAGEAAIAGVDPITCSQNTPDTITIGNTETNGNTATVFVREAWGQIETKIQVQLINENNKWLVENVICPPLKN